MILYLADARRRGRELQESARQNEYRKRKQESCRRGEYRRCDQISLSDPAKQIQAVGRVLDICSVNRGVGDKLPDPYLCLEIDKIVAADTSERDQHDDKALVFQLQADFGDDPAEQAGEYQHDDRYDKEQDDSAYHILYRSADDHPVDDQRRQHHNARVHRAEQVHVQQS